jgi:monoamine oxidase
MIGTAAGSSAMYQAMTTLGLAAESSYKGPIRLDGDPKGASILILGAGIAGLVAAFELSKVGYRVQVLEYNDRAGGRCWSLRGGDRFTELGGFEQTCGFDRDLYFNPGPWRIPYHHGGVLDYCKRRRQPRTVHPGQLQRVSARQGSFRREAAALAPHTFGLPRRHRRTSRQGGKPEQAR